MVTEVTYVHRCTAALRGEDGVVNEGQRQQQEEYLQGDC